MSGARKCPHTPTTALSAAIHDGGDVHGRPARGNGVRGWDDGCGFLFSGRDLPRRGLPAILEDLLGCWCASSRLVSRHPFRRRLANMSAGRTFRKSLSAGLAGPGVRCSSHCSGVIGLSFAGGSSERVRSRGLLQHLFSRRWVLPTGTPRRRTDRGRRGSCQLAAEDGVAVVARVEQELVRQIRALANFQSIDPSRARSPTRPRGP